MQYAGLPELDGCFSRVLLELRRLLLASLQGRLQLGDPPLLRLQVSHQPAGLRLLLCTRCCLRGDKHEHW